MSNLKSYVIHTIGGGWGKETIEENLIKVSVIRGTDFPKLEKLDFSSVPIRFETLKKIESRTLQVGDLIIEVSGGSASSGQRTGRCLYITQEILDNLGKYVIPASFCRLLRLDKEKINSKFIYYQIAEMHLSDQIGIYENQSTGISNFQFNLFLDEIFPKITDLNKQNSIVDIFNSIDQKIQVNTKINQTLEQIAQALFKSWFVDFDPVHAKAQALSDGMSLEQAELAAMQAISGKTPEELTALSQTQPECYAELAETAKAFPCEMVEVDGVEVPKGWEIKPIELILDRLKNKQKLRKEEISFEGTIPVFEQGASILMGYHDKDAAFNASIDEPIFIFGDHTCITKLSTIPFSIYQNVIPLIGKNLPTYWVYCAIQNKQTFQEYRRHWAELIVKEVFVPDNINLCQYFSKKVKELFFKIDINYQENKTLIETRDILLPKLLNGDI